MNETAGGGPQEAIPDKGKPESVNSEKTAPKLGLVYFSSKDDPLLDETAAWIWQDFANSCYSTVSIATFLPLVINSYATTQAWVLSGEDMPPYCSDLATEYSEACIECRVGEGDLLCTGSGTGTENCDSLDVPSIGGISAASFSFFIIGMSCLSQLVAFVLWGQSGDYSDNRKQYCLAANLIGASSLIAFAFFPVGEGYAKHVIAALLTILANTAFGLAQIFYNAYLPLISDDFVAKDPTLNQGDVENKISSIAMASGYYAGVIGLIFSIIILTISGGTDEDSSELVIASSFRWCVVFSGCWWFIGTLLTVPRFQQRPGKPGSLPWYATAQEFWKTISWTYTNLPITFKYLCLYFAYSDGFSTISGLGLMYARLDMCASTTSLFVVAIEAPLCAALGNFIFLWISRKFNLSNRTMVVMVLCLISFLPFWGLLGYVSTTIGFRQLWEVYLLGAYFGFSLGAIQNFTRTFFIELIPKSRESEYFSFYELTDKGSSWLGPLVVAALASNSSGNLRLAFIYILFMTLVPAFFLYKLDVDQGKIDAQKVSDDDIASNNTGETQALKAEEGGGATGGVELVATATD
jgi:UMF1 family MFS transporter